MFSHNTTHKMGTYQSPVAITVKTTVLQLQYSMYTIITTYITLVTSHDNIQDNKQWLKLKTYHWNI